MMPNLQMMILKLVFRAVFEKEEEDEENFQSQKELERKYSEVSIKVNFLKVLVSASFSAAANLFNSNN